MSATKLEQAKIVNEILPQMSVAFVVDYFKPSIMRERYNFNGQTAIEFFEPEPIKEDNSKFICQNEGWYDYKNSKGGRGAFSLLSHLLGHDHWRDTINYIKDNFLENLQLSPYAKDLSLDSLSIKARGQEQSEWKIPERIDDYLPAIVEYLNQKRGIPLETIQRCVENGSLYASERFVRAENGLKEGNVKCCVFKGKENAEIRTIDDVDGLSFKGASKGSNKHSGFQVIPEMNLLTLDDKGTVKKGTGYFVLVEAAIDAMSYNAIFPNRFAVSSNGSGKFEQHYQKMMVCLNSEQNISVRVAFDADKAGNEAAQRMFNAYYFRQLMLARKIRSKSGEVIDSVENRIKLYLKQEEREDDWTSVMDDWILEGKVQFDIYNSPHIMFFNDIYYRESYNVLSDERGGDLEVLGQGKATVRFKIKDPIIANILSVNANTWTEVNVSRENYERIVSERLVREMPLLTKDWNDELKRMGSEYLAHYTQAHQENFQQGMPIVDVTKNPSLLYRERNLLNIKEKLMPYLKSEEANKVVSDNSDLYSQVLKVHYEKEKLYKYQPPSIKDNQPQYEDYDPSYLDAMDENRDYGSDYQAYSEQNQNTHVTEKTTSGMFTKNKAVRQTSSIGAGAVQQEKQIKRIDLNEIVVPTIVRKPKSNS